MVAVDEEAGDPPLGRSQIHFAIPTHSTRKLDKGSELTPPGDIRPVVDEGRMGSVRSNQLLFERPMLPGPPFLLATREVVGDAPAAAPDPIVFLNHSLELRPRLHSEKLVLS